MDSALVRKIRPADKVSRHSLGPRSRRNAFLSEATTQNEAYTTRIVMSCDAVNGVETRSRKRKRQKPKSESAMLTRARPSQAFPTTWS